MSLYIQRSAGDPNIETCPKCGTEYHMVETIIEDGAEPYEAYFGPFVHCDRCHWTRKDDDAAFERVVRRGRFSKSKV